MVNTEKIIFFFSSSAAVVRVQIEQTGRRVDDDSIRFDPGDDIVDQRHQKLPLSMVDDEDLMGAVVK
jgi:hypothetical protein